MSVHAAVIITTWYWKLNLWLHIRVWDGGSWYCLVFRYEVDPATTTFEHVDFWLVEHARYGSG